MGVLVLLFVLPVFDVNGYYGAAPTFDEGGLALLHTMYGAGGDTAAFREVVQVGGWGGRGRGLLGPGQRHWHRHAS